MKIRDLLNSKEFKYRDVVTVKPEDTVFQAILILVEHNMGALPVCTQEGNLVGIITERDIVRKCLTNSSNMNKVTVGSVMSRDVIIGGPDDDTDYVVSAMKQAKIRHLPVLDNRKLVGMISMRDILGIELEQTRASIRHLSDYISGTFGNS